MLIGERRKLIGGGWAGEDTGLTDSQIETLVEKSKTRGKFYTGEEVEEFQKTGHLPD